MRKIHHGFNMSEHIFIVVVRVRSKAENSQSGDLLHLSIGLSQVVKSSEVISLGTIHDLLVRQVCPINGLEESIRRGNKHLDFVRLRLNGTKCVQLGGDHFSIGLAKDSVLLQEHIIRTNTGQGLIYRNLDRLTIAAVYTTCCNR